MAGAMENDLDTCYKRADSVVARQIAGKSLLVPICGELADLQQLFTLNDVGDFIWAKMDGSKTIKNLSDEVANNFEVTADIAKEDSVAFLSMLEDAGLITKVVNA